MALPKLTAADLQHLATDHLPLLSALPDRPRNANPPRLRARQRARPSTRTPTNVPRRLRRYHNDVALALAAAASGALPTSSADLAALFQPHTRCEFDTLLSDPAARDAWERFIALDDNSQRAVLAVDDTVQSSHPPCVDARLRHLIKNRGAVVRPLVEHVESQVLNLPQGESVRLVLTSPFSRLVAHAVAQFHRMKSRSYDVGDQRVTVISATRPPHAVRLLDALA